MPCCKKLEIDRTKEAERASNGIIDFIRDQEKGKKVVAIFGLPLVGKTTLGHQICNLVIRSLENNNVNCMLVLGYYSESTSSYVIRDCGSGSHFQSFSDLEKHLVRFPLVTFMVFLDDICEADLIDGLLNHRNCCFVIASRKRMQFAKWGRRVQYLKLSPLNADESKNYICRHLQPDDWSYRLNQISENCQGFPRLLSAVTGVLLGGSVELEEIYQCSFKELCHRFLSEGEREICSKFWSHVSGVDGAVPEVYIPSLVIMRGSFGTRDVAALSRIPTKVKAKKALIEPLFGLGIVFRDNQSHDRGDSFVISEIIRALLEDRYSYLQNDSDLRSRFCNYFAKIFSDLETKMMTDMDEFFSIFLGVHPNLLALVERAVYCLKEEYDVLINLGRQAELIIMSFLQAREVVTFYEACAKAAKERGSKTDYARMLSALGHSLLVICPDMEAARERIWEAYDLMTKDPNICPTEIALTTSHKGHYYHLRGDTAAGIRHYKEALCIYERQYRDLVGTVNPGPDDTQVRFLKLCRLRMKNNIAISAGCMGQYDYSIKLHGENIKTYQEVFKSDLGTGKAYHCIGLMQHLKGDEEGALKNSRIGLDIKRRSHSKRPSLSIVYSMSLVGTSYFYSDRRDAARALRYLDDALAMIDDLKRNHADRSLLLNSKGTIYLGTGDYVEAEKMFREAAEIRLREFGMGANCCTAEALQYLGETYHRLGEFDKAVTTLRRCLFLELEYYKQVPVAFEGRILETLDWLRKGLVGKGAGKSTIAFVDEFVTKVETLTGVQKDGEADTEAAENELKTIIERAYRRLDLERYREMLVPEEK